MIFSHALGLASTVSAFPTPSNDQIFLGYLIVGLITLLNAAGTGVIIWDKVRRKPPLAESLLSNQTELAKVYATKQELADSSDRLRSELSTSEERLRSELAEHKLRFNANVTELFNQLHDLIKSVNEGFRSVERSLGQLEGKLK